jgi:hypothetical protein
MKKGWRTNLTVNWRFREKPRKREKRKNLDELWKKEKRERFVTNCRNGLNLIEPNSQMGFSKISFIKNEKIIL